MDGSAFPPRRPAGTALPRLLVTGQFVFHGRVGGAEHMFYNLVRGLGQERLDLGVLACPANLDPAFVAELDGSGSGAGSGAGTLLPCAGGTGSRFVAEQRACLRPDLHADAVLFSNYFVPPLVPRRLGRVSTVLHDMQFRHFPANFSARKRAWLAAAQGFAVRRADRVIAISDFVRADILRQYGQRFAPKVVTVPNPISWDRFGPDNGVRPMEAPYILSVAAAYAHKNLEVLLHAFATVAARDRAVQLVFCGQDYAGLRGVSGARPGLAAMAAAMGLAERVHVTGYVDDRALGTWFRHAAVFAFPSVFEGFGMPPVEALGFGVPTITTALTALPEVTLGLSRTVKDPNRAEEWASLILDSLRDPAAHRPDAAAVDRLRHHYSPARIGRLYAQACLN